MSTPERHQRIYQLFVKLKGLEPRLHKAYLEQACGPDAELHREVEALLAQEVGVSSFLDFPPDFAEVAEGLGQEETRSGEAGEELSPQPPSDPGSEKAVPKIEGYEIIRELHRGGQGVVYQALQEAFKRKVAIKVLREGPYASKAASISFEREIELVAQLKHPNIIAVFDSGTTPEGWRYCAMDYIRGLPLHQYVRENHLTLEQALKVFCAVCDAVQYAHHKGVIHRDLKPSNILVDGQGHPKILDFGLAKQLIEPVEVAMSLTKDVVGTLPYMSPEQARGNPDHIDTRTDIYALGVILYELLTGHYPYPVVGQMADVLRNIAETPPTPPTRGWTPDSGITQRSGRHVRAGHCPIDGELQTVILKTLAKERERRYQSAGDLARDIAHYLANEPIEAKRDSAWYLLRKTLARHKAKFAVAAGFVLLLAGFGMYVHSTARERQCERLIDEGRKDYQGGYSDSAGSRFREALALDPRNANALATIAWWELEDYRKKPFDKKDQTLLKEARLHCTQALDAGKDNARIWIVRGAIEMLLGEFAAAEAALVKALDKETKNPQATGYLAMVYALQGHVDEALETAEAIVGDEVQTAGESGEKGYEDHFWRAVGTLQLYRREPEALKSLTRAQQTDRADMRNTLMLARLRISLPKFTNYQLALDLARRADAGTDLRDPRFKRILALAQLREGQYEDAAVNAEAALRAGDVASYCHVIAALAEARLADSAARGDERERHRAEAEQRLRLELEARPTQFSDRDVIMTAEKDFLWFDTLAELQDLRDEAVKLLSASAAADP